MRRVVSGFSLMEVLVSLFLLGMILEMLQGSFLYLIRETQKDYLRFEAINQGLNTQAERQMDQSQNE